MHLVYVDESGNSGLNLNDPQQPVFALCAMIVPEDKWHGLESDLKKSLNERFPAWKTIDGFEVHGSELRTGNGNFAGMSVADRIAFRDTWMDIGASHQVRLIARTVYKRAYANWLVRRFGHGVTINPHVVAFALLARCVDNYLATLPGNVLGMFISDENKEIVRDVEKSISVLKEMDGVLRLTRIVEKGFFIDSTKSLPLQLCDLFTMSLRKNTERKRMGLPAKSFDDSGISRALQLLWEDKKHDTDILDWLVKTAQKRSGQGG